MHDRIGKNVEIRSEGGIYRARGFDSPAGFLAKLLRHHWLRCRGAHGIDVRGDYIDRGNAHAEVRWSNRSVWDAECVAFLCRALHYRCSQRAMAGALECQPFARPSGSMGSGIRADCFTADAAADRL